MVNAEDTKSKINEILQTVDGMITHIGTDIIIIKKQDDNGGRTSLSMNQFMSNLKELDSLASNGRLVFDIDINIQLAILNYQRIVHDSDDSLLSKLAFDMLIRSLTEKLREQDPYLELSYTPTGLNILIAGVPVTTDTLKELLRIATLKFKCFTGGLGEPLMSMYTFVQDLKNIDKSIKFSSDFNALTELLVDENIVKDSKVKLGLLFVGALKRYVRGLTPAFSVDENNIFFDSLVVCDSKNISSLLKMGKIILGTDVGIELTIKCAEDDSVDSDSDTFLMHELMSELKTESVLRIIPTLNDLEYAIDGVKCDVVDINHLNNFGLLEITVPELVKL